MSPALSPAREPIHASHTTCRTHATSAYAIPRTHDRNPNSLAPACSHVEFGVDQDVRPPNTRVSRESEHSRPTMLLVVRAGTRARKKKAEFLQRVSIAVTIAKCNSRVLDCMRHDWQSATAPDLVTSTVHNPGTHFGRHKRPRHTRPNGGHLSWGALGALVALTAGGFQLTAGGSS
jgi:hypothetical protein